MSSDNRVTYRTPKSTLCQFLKYALFITVTLIVILPILVIFFGSFKTGEEFNRSKPFSLPTFTSNTEVWKGECDLSSKQTLKITPDMLAGHKMRALTFVFDNASGVNSFICIYDADGKKIVSLPVKQDSTEASVEIGKDAALGLIARGFTAEGNGCTLRRVKTLEPFLFGNYVTAFTKGNMLLGFFNTLILIVFSGLGTVFTGSMTAYVLSRFSFKLKKIIYTMFLWISLIPTITAQVATFQIIQKLGMYNTRLSCIILSMGTDIISIMIYIQYLNNISVSLDESAIIDGAGYWQVFSQIILPLLTPATVTILILKCVNLYNDFYNPLLYMPKDTLMVISTSLYKFKGPFGTNWPVICAGVVIAVIPTLAAFLMLQKYIYNGMVTGSVKE